MFRFEKDMIPIICDGLKAKYNLNYICEEFSSGLGFVDIAAAKTLKERATYTEDIELVYIIFNFLNRKNKKLSLNRIAKKYNLRKEIASRAINYLELNEFVHSNEFGELFLTQKLEPAIDELYTIEAKLKDWRSAIFQARRNKAFSSKSFVAFPESQITKQKIELCKENRIGLISVKTDSISIIVNSITNKEIDKTNFYYTAETFTQRMTKEENAILL